MRKEKSSTGKGNAFIVNVMDIVKHNVLLFRRMKRRGYLSLGQNLMMKKKDQIM